MKLHELSLAVSSLQETIENLEGVDIPDELTEAYLGLLAESEETNAQFLDKIDSTVGFIQSTKYWLAVRKEEVERLKKLIKKDEKTIEWLTDYLKQHLEKIGKTKFRTNKFNISIRKASVAPLHLLVEDAKSYPQQYQKVTIEVDKKALKEAIIKGNEEALKYGELGEKTTYLSFT